MKFGKEFTTHLEETIPEWRDKFLCYKLLKKLLKRLPPNLDVHQKSLRDEPCGLPHHAEHLQDWFVRILNEELEKLNDFYVDKEEEFIILFQELKDRIERVKEKSSNDAVFTSDDEFSEETMDIREDFVTIHGKMILLKNYSSLNFAGLMKILKKYDKRTGGLLRIPFTQLVLRQPFFTTEPLTRLVNECEANLELLFPLEAEVIESSTSQGNPCITPQSRTTDTTSRPSATLSEETLDIQRSTLAAMKAIRGLQKASSTSNPLSFSALMRNLDDEGNGGVTAENSPANSPADFENDEKSDEENTHTE